MPHNVVLIITRKIISKTLFINVAKNFGEEEIAVKAGNFNGPVGSNQENY